MNPYDAEAILTIPLGRGKTVCPRGHFPPSDPGVSTCSPSSCVALLSSRLAHSFHPREHRVPPECVSSSRSDGTFYTRGAHALPTSESDPPHSSPRTTVESFIPRSTPRTPRPPHPRRQLPPSPSLPSSSAAPLSSRSSHPFHPREHLVPPECVSSSRSDGTFYNRGAHALPTSEIDPPLSSPRTTVEPVTACSTPRPPRPPHPRRQLPPSPSPFRGARTTPEGDDLIDRLVWHFEEDGVYTVRSGYKLARSTTREGPSSSPPHDPRWWKTM